MHTESTEGHQETRTSRIRSYMYWISSVLATLVFLMFAYVMSMVPGVPLSQKLWMLSIAGTLLIASLGIGAWKFWTDKVPLMAWPLGPIVGVVLLLELAECIISIFQLATTHL
jgi:hypothetical protein